MRTAIFLGCVAIADAIRSDWYPTDDSTKTFIGVMVLVMAAMDVLDFIRKHSSRKS